jgi:hypothetical protein
MKRLAKILGLTLVALYPAFTQAQNGLEKDPAYLAIDDAIDLKTIRPEVNVNLPRFLLQDALSEFNGGTDDPLAGTGINIADLVKDIKLIRVVVIQAKETNRVELDKGLATLRATLESKWTAIATVPEENVGVYALSDASGEKMMGLAVLVQDKSEAVIANIVGRVSIGKIVKLASQSNKFPKDLLKKLMKAGNPEKGEKPVADGEKPVSEVEKPSPK